MGLFGRNKQKVDVEASFKATGLKKIRTDWLDFMGDLAEPMLLLAAGATKMEAAWAGARGVFLTKVLGPLGMVAGAAMALSVVMTGLIKKFRELGMQGAAEFERIQLQLKPLLGSMAAAKKRVKELFEFTAKTPFQLGDVARANKSLETLTKGALSARDGMMLVGDSAAVAGVPMQDVARQVGRLYDGLQSGRPVGEAAMRLQELGLISGETRSAMESMQAAGQAGNEIWLMVQQELSKTKGAMAELSKSYTGMQTTHADTKMQLEAGFGKGFMEGEKATLAASITVMEKMTPVAAHLGSQIGTVTNWFDKMKAKTKEAVTSLPGFTTAMMLGGNAVMILTAALITATGAAFGKFIVSAMTAAGTQRALTAATAGSTAAQATQAAVTGGLTVASTQLRNALVALSTMNFLTAAGHLKVAASATLAAFKTNAAAASVVVLRGAMIGLAAVTKFVVAQLWALTVALMTNPFFLVAAGVLALVAAFVNMANKSAKAREELGAYRKETEALNDQLENQIRSIKTMIDLRKQEAEVTKRLTEAIIDEEKAVASGNEAAVKAAQERQASIMRALAAVRDFNREQLKMTGSEKGREEIEFTGKKEVKRMQREAAREGMNAAEKLTDSEKKLLELTRARVKAEADLRAQKDSQRAITDSQQEANDLKVENDVRMRKIRALKEERKAFADRNGGAGMIEKWREDGVSAAQATIDYYDALTGSINNLEKASAKAQVQIEEGSSGIRQLLASDSEVDNLKAKISLYDQQERALKRLQDAQKALSDAPGREEDGWLTEGDEIDNSKLEEEVNAAQRAKNALDALAQSYGGLRGARDREKAGIDLERKEKEINDNLDPRKIAEAELLLTKEKRDLESQVARIKLDAEAKIASLKNRGLAAEMMAVDFAWRKYRLAWEQKKMTDDELRAKKEMLTAEKTELARRAREESSQMTRTMTENRLRRQAEDARKAGNNKEEKALKGRADLLRDESVRAQAQKAIEGVSRDPAQIAAYVAQALEDDRAERKRNLEEDREGRKKEQGQALAEVGQLKVDVLRSVGKFDEANKLQKDVDAKSDEIKQSSLEKRFRGSGFDGKSAKTLAERQVKLEGAQRLFDRLGGLGTTSASALTRAGGGGIASGIDVNRDLLTDIRDTLRTIEKNTNEEPSAFQLN